MGILCLCSRYANPSGSMGQTTWLHSAPELVVARRFWIASMTSWKRALVEAFTWLVSRSADDAYRNSGALTIFVLRNNDIGDLLVVTPLFDALKRRFPDNKIVVGVGNWNFPVLQNNPHLSEVLPIN